MDRRRFLGLAGTTALAGTMALAGCGQLDGPANVWPEPTVVDHFRGEPTVTGVQRQLVVDAPARYRVTVENAGHAATVRVRLYWVTEGGHDPRNLTQDELTTAGYTVADETRIQMEQGQTDQVVLRGSQPASALGFFVRARNLTYGATVANDGGAGQIRAELVDTTDLTATRTLARRRVRLPGGDSRDVVFQSAATFETFRVDVAVPLLGT